MTAAKLFILSYHEARRRAAQYIAEAPEGYTVSVAPPKRSGDQNARLHAVLGEIAERVEWAGAKRDPETWKRLLTAAWLRERGEALEYLPALDGRGIDIVFKRTSSLSRAECAELMEYVDAWASQQGIVLGAAA